MKYVIGALQWKLLRAPLPFNPALLAGNLYFNKGLQFCFMEDFDTD